jgi:hypothetical protein
MMMVVEDEEGGYMYCAAGQREKEAVSAAVTGEEAVPRETDEIITALRQEQSSSSFPSVYLFLFHCTSSKAEEDACRMQNRPTDCMQTKFYARFFVPNIFLETFSAAVL